MITAQAHVMRAIDQSFPACYKISLRIAFSNGRMCACRTDAIAPDAAKPQHFCLEVEARFREKSRSSVAPVCIANSKGELAYPAG
jgi:hypothetical protein